MKFIVLGDNYTFTDETKTKAENILSGLCRMKVADECDIATISVKPYGNSYKTTVSVESKVGLLKANTIHDDVFTGFELSVKKIEDVIRQQKVRLSICYEHLFGEVNGAAHTDVLTETVQLHEMNVDEAILAMELSSKPFYMYKDLKSKRVTVVYRSNDGRYKNVSE